MGPEGHGAQPRGLGHGCLRSEAHAVGRDTASWDGAQAEVGGARGVGPEGDKDEQQGADHGGDGDLQLPSLGLLVLGILVLLWFLAYLGFLCDLEDELDLGHFHGLLHLLVLLRMLLLLERHLVELLHLERVETRIAALLWVVDVLDRELPLGTSLFGGHCVHIGGSLVIFGFF